MAIKESPWCLANLHIPREFSLSLASNSWPAGPHRRAYRQEQNQASSLNRAVTMKAPWTMYNEAAALRIVVSKPGPKPPNQALTMTPGKNVMTRS
jgi:hypothetical protein